MRRAFHTLSAMPTTMGAQSQTSTCRPQMLVFEREEAVRVDVRQPFAADFQNDDRGTSIRIWRSKRGLAQVAAHPAPEAQIDEGGEGPDLLHLDEVAENSGGQAERRVEGQRQVFVVEDGGDGEHDAAQHGPAGADAAGRGE